MTFLLYSIESGLMKTEPEKGQLWSGLLSPSNYRDFLVLLTSVAVSSKATVALLHL